jgi:hypothetical protein
MLSAGTEFFLAFAIASKSVGFPETSAPPALADTSIALINFLNSKNLIEEAELSFCHIFSLIY